MTPARRGHCHGLRIYSFMIDRETLVKRRTPFEVFLLLPLSPSHLLSSLYTFLQTSSTALCSGLGVGVGGNLFLNSNGKNLFYFHISCPWLALLRRRTIKMILQWYGYPVLLHRMYPSVSEKCWRCENTPGTMLHIWCLKKKKKIHMFSI